MANIKYRYDKEDDALMIFLGKGTIDDAQQSGTIISHLSKEGDILLLEILNASKFLKEASRMLPPEVRRQVAAG